LIDFLLSREVEAALAASPSAQIPLRDEVARPDHVPRLGALRRMPVDWRGIGSTIEERSRELAERFLR
jgi:ABC-type Fe3+ transport system substrate-binding protein